MREDINLSEEEMILYAQEAEDRSTIYMLVSVLYSQVPNTDLIKKIKSDEFIQTLRGAILEEESELKNGLRNIDLYLNSIKGIPESEVADNLAVDFTKLFRGIKRGYGPPPPYESVWRGENRVMGEWTQRVLRFYHQTGIGMDIKDEIPDYIGLELKFMAILSYREAKAWRKNDIMEAARFLMLQQSFMNDHIRQWQHDFYNRVVEEAATTFYKGIALITNGFLNIEAQRIKETLELIN